ncbi:MAG: hypothetical protein LC635_01055, partial [Pseudonocardiaceae bacterium]|nr:hypothetical protein [Pseudonocardiaceae bacterium]
MTQPAPGYQPYQPPRPMQPLMTPPRPPRGGLTSLLAGALALVTAGLAVGGSFATVQTFRNEYTDGDGTEEFRSTATWWSYEDLDGSGSGFLAGLVPVLAAVLLVMGAMFAFVASRTRRPGSTAAGRALITAGVATLLGGTLMQLFNVLEQSEQYNEQDLTAGESLEFTSGLGLYLPLVAVLIGIVTVVLAHTGQREPRVEPNTPRMGFPAPYGMYPPGPVPPLSERPTDVSAAAASVPPVMTPGEPTPPAGSVSAALAGESSGAVRPGAPV